mmetsp:Transcript_8807/g.28181  ORF Transcript_8807/g.28181 Transcript_8807/m.28181 type:complete len:340 (-) Transcript_8807:67-1086(-)
MVVSLEWPWENFSWAPMEALRDETATKAFLRTKVSTGLFSIGSAAFGWGMAIYLTVWLRKAARAGATAAGSYGVVWWIRANLLSLAFCASFIGLILLANVNHRGGQWQCIIGCKCSAFSYVVGAWSSYRVLLLRARSTLFNQPRRLQTLFWICTLLNTYVVPVIGFQVLIFFQPAFIFEDHCVLFVRPTLMWMFMIADTALSLGLLALFAVPVLMHVKMVRSAGMTTNKLGTEADKLKLKVERDLRIGSVHVFTTMFVMGLGATLATLIELRRETSYLRVGDLIAYMIDMFVNARCILAITSVWKLRGKEQRLSTAVRPAEDAATSATSLLTTADENNK